MEHRPREARGKGRGFGSIMSTRVQSGELRAGEPRISARERLVLTSIIESYIATGEPVGSQTLARQFGNHRPISGVQPSYHAPRWRG